MAIEACTLSIWKSTHAFIVAYKMRRRKNDSHSSSSNSNQLNTTDSKSIGFCVAKVFSLSLSLPSSYPFRWMHITFRYINLYSTWNWSSSFQFAARHIAYELNKSYIIYSGLVFIFIFILTFFLLVVIAASFGKISKRKGKTEKKCNK